MRPEVIGLFREVADRTPPEREEYYAREQVADVLRDEVESLLRYDVSGDSLRGFVASAQRALLDSPAPDPEDGPRTSGLPDRIGRFEVTRLLGRGGMGDVYLARDPVIERPVAIKLIAGGLEDETARRRLVREARTAGRLRHPNIVTIFETGEHGNGSFIAMEYVPGETLGSIIRRRAPLPLRRRLEMMEGACAGLAHAHRAGVIHLDIKPDNLMLDDGGIVKVLDFGISRVLQNESLLTMHVAGTLRYMSPEQVQGKPLDHRSDVFSLGCSLFELVSYAPAYSGSTKEIVNQIALGPVPSLIEACPQLDSDLDAIVSRAMALEPSDRYEDLEAMRAAIAAVRARLDPAGDEQAAALAGVAPESAASVSARRRSSSAPRARAAWRSRAVAAAGLAAAGLATAVAFTVWGGSEPTLELPRTEAVVPAPAASAPPPEPEPSLTVDVAQPPAPTDELWRRLAAEDREGVLEWLARAAPARGTGGTTLANAVVDTVRTTVLRARDDAAKRPGGSATDTYRSGEEQLARAGRLAAAGQPVESLRALWQASDLYARTAATPAAPAAATADPRPSATEGSSPARGQLAGSGARVAETNAALEAGAVRPPPAVTPPAVPPSPGPSPAGAPSAGAPATAAAPVASRGPDVPAATNPPATGPAADAAAVREVIQRYARAFEALDLAAVLKVYPSLDSEQVDQLRRTFEEDVKSYEMDIRITDLQVMGESARVRADVARRMTPRIGGSPISRSVETEFRLQRAGGGWTIVSAVAR